MDNNQSMKNDTKYPPPFDDVADSGKENSSEQFNLFVRETCKGMLDIQVPISLQPRDKIQDIVDLCIKKFSNCQPEVARKRVGIFLKNCRKTEKRKIQDHRPSRGLNAKKKKKLTRELPPSPPSPWAVGSLTEFLHFKCPICDFTCKEESAFLQHAYQFHKESVVYLCTLTIEDPGNVVIEDPDFFDNDDHQVQETADNPMDESWTTNGGDGQDSTSPKPKTSDTKDDIKEPKFPEMKVEVNIDENVEDTVPFVTNTDLPESGEMSDSEKPLASFKCHKCSKAFSSSQKLDKHLRHTHDARPYQCSQCESTFSTQGKLNQHTLRAHFDGEKPFKCDQCSASFIEKYRLDRHVETVHSTESNYVCDKCPKTFKAANKLKRHVLSFHEQVRTHQCDQCDKAFFANYELKAHKSYVHEKNMNYQCDKCPNSYTTHTGLKRHNASVHGEGIQCPKCPRRVPNQWDLYRHIAQSHDGVRKHKCDQCPKAFILPKDLERHILSIHQGIKSEVCDICNKAFALKGNLTAHRKKVHKDILNSLNPL